MQPAVQHESKPAAGMGGQLQLARLVQGERPVAIEKDGARRPAGKRFMGGGKAAFPAGGRHAQEPGGIKAEKGQPRRIETIFSRRRRDPHHRAGTQFQEKQGKKAGRGPARFMQGAKLKPALQGVIERLAAGGKE